MLHENKANVNKWFYTQENPAVKANLVAEVAANAVVAAATTPTQESDVTSYGSQLLFTPSEDGDNEGALDMIHEIISSEPLTPAFQELMDVAETTSLVSTYNGTRRNVRHYNYYCF